MIILCRMQPWKSNITHLRLSGLKSRWNQAENSHIVHYAESLIQFHGPSLRSVWLSGVPIAHVSILNSLQTDQNIGRSFYAPHLSSLVLDNVLITTEWLSHFVNSPITALSLLKCNIIYMSPLRDFVQEKSFSHLTELNYAPSQPDEARDLSLHTGIMSMCEEMGIAYRPQLADIYSEDDVSDED